MCGKLMRLVGLIVLFVVPACSLGGRSGGRTGTPVSSPSPTLAAEHASTPSAVETPSTARPRVQPGGQVVTYVPSDGIGNIAVRLTFPDAPRYPDGAGVVVDVAPFFTDVDDFYEDLDAAPLGLIRIAYLWPGKASHSTGARSDGEYDYGGEIGIQALRDVIRFAAGQIPDRDGHTIGDLSPFPVLTDQVGLYAFSHPGIAAVNVLALYGDQLHVRYFVGRENPTVDAISAVELGYWDEGGRPVINPLYHYPESYSPTAISLDYSSVRWKPDQVYPQRPDVVGYPYFDLNGNGRYDATDFILSYKMPTMFGKRVYSVALTQALRENGVFDAHTWPEDVATPEEAAAWWAFRVTPPRYSDLAQRAPNLKVLLLFCQKGHVQPLPDRPQIHQAYDGFHHTAGLWTRLNPDAAYMPAATFPGYQDHPANTEPDDWTAFDDWAYPPVNMGAKLAPQAAVAEMADRTHEDNWEPDLSAALYPLEVAQTSTPAPTPPSEHRCGDGVCDGPENVQNCPQDCAPATEEGGAPVTGDRRGFIVIHADPQEILNLHENYDPATFDYDRNGVYEAEDAWQALMDLVDLADAHGIPLTFQFSPPYIDFMRQSRCDRLLGAGRTYPQGGRQAYTRCIDLVNAWEANGHELSLHHHGPLHDPVKFDGYTNRQVYSVMGRRPCSSKGDAACGCEGNCYWCAPPDAPLACGVTEGPPPGPVGVDDEWIGRIEEGPDNMMSLVYSVFGEGRIRSYCSNHGDEPNDMPSDPNIIYTTQGVGYVNDAEPLCLAYDIQREYHAQTKYTWFYAHGPVFTYQNLREAQGAIRGMQPGQVVGLVFHVNDFLKSEANLDDPHYGGHIRALFAFLNDPQDGGGPVRIETLSDLMVEAGKTAAPDPCVETCFTQDENADRASYTVQVPPPSSCQKQ